MPKYTFRCFACAHEEDQRREVDRRNEATYCPECKNGLMTRRFTPTAMVITPEHFRYLASWCLPDKTDTEAWDARVNPSQTHAPKMKTLKEHLHEDLLTREKITLSSG